MPYQFIHINRSENVAWARLRLSSPLPNPSLIQTRKSALVGYKRRRRAHERVRASQFGVRALVRSNSPMLSFCVSTYLPGASLQTNFYAPNAMQTDLRWFGWV